ncbi:MAG: YqaJ-like viral recombinase domain [Barrevirus sp.]|uniref:YqaJ-like viral recombinase domain n=1 Tax=Barrevirus sp. TaxID=2487763 RepID=A0A3G4ZPX5_9VIRU|nr:MAG: YqaJ-like viral recombinase domain [Barrevirus sp.]
MSKLLNYDKKIQKIIEDDHDGLFYDNEEITDVLNNIVEQVTKIKTEKELIANSLTFFVYKSEKKGKYYLNIKKQIQKKDYHETLLLTLMTKEEEEEEVEEKDLEELEREIFNREEPEEIEEIKDDEEEEDEEDDGILYVYPSNPEFTPSKKYYFEPKGTQWVHDKQVDDKITEREVKLSKQFDILRAIILPEQRSAKWFEMRDEKITASDGGTVLDVNPHEQQYKFILKKTIGLPFISNEFVYHGKKLEEIAILIYEYRMNIKCEAFGLIGHPKYKFLGASPDSIAGKYKLNGQHKSKYIGRMLEIKCPFVRKIKMDGPIIDHICPIYYWVQVQLQLECCDLEECDFWQCEIREYESREEFIADTMVSEPFRSKEWKMEKGCLIQLLPKEKMQQINDGDYNKVVWDDAFFIYPPRIEMTPYDCDLWIAQTMADLPKKPEYDKYFFDKVIYWKIVVSKNVVINRDRKWFADSLPLFEKMWSYVQFFRKNKDKLDLLIKYIDSRPRKKNKDIMGIVEKIYNVSDPDYKTIIKNINDNIVLMLNNRGFKEDADSDEYMFVNTTEVKVEPKRLAKVTGFQKQGKGTQDDDDDGYMFAEAPKKSVTVAPKKIIPQKKQDDDDYMFSDAPKSVSNTLVKKPTTNTVIKKPSINSTITAMKKPTITSATNATIKKPTVASVNSTVAKKPTTTFVKKPYVKSQNVPKNDEDDYLFV